MNLGIQLYSLRKYLVDEQGYEDAFKRCHDMHAECVQLSGGKPIAPELLREYSDKYNLPICITHDNFSRLQNDLDGLINEHKVYNSYNLGIGMMPNEYRTSLDGLKSFVKFLNDTAEKLKDEGMTISYHNHWFEFNMVDGVKPYDYLIENTRDVLFIPDTFWIKFAGEDILSYIEKLTDRINTIHLKDYKAKIFRAVGKGTLDFKSILDGAEKAGAKNAVVELDMSINPYKSMEYSMNTLLKIRDGN